MGRGSWLHVFPMVGQICLDWNRSGGLPVVAIAVDGEIVDLGSVQGTRCHTSGPEVTPLRDSHIS